MLAFSALVAGSFALGSRIANDIAPAALNAVRFLIAAGIVGGLALATIGPPRAVLRAPWRFAILGGLFAIYFVAMFEALKTATSVSTAAVFTLTPALSAVFGYILLGQRATPRLLLALSIGAAGAIWVIFDADPRALIAFDLGRGELIFFLGCIAHAAYTPTSRLLNRGEPAVVMTFGMLIAGSVLLMLAGWQDLRDTDWAALPPLVWITLIYLAVGASAVTFVLLQFAALRLPAAKVMAYTYLTPSWVILWEIALGGAAPPAVLLIGVALTCLALWLLLEDD